MAKKDSRAGGKYTGNHTTLIPAAALICDIAHVCSAVTRISPGFIKSGLRSVSGKRRIKITEREGSLLLSIRDNTSHQEVHVYATDVQAAKLAIARGAQQEHMLINLDSPTEDSTIL